MRAARDSYRHKPSSVPGILIAAAGAGVFTASILRWIVPGDLPTAVIALVSIAAGVAMAYWGYRNNF
jgi:divalent metal cation (Fe/Co/Zn/Cd) transporter